MSSRPFRLIVLLALTVLLALPAVAAAETPIEDQYGTPTVVEGTSDDAATTVGSLPFTGAELRYLVIAGAALLGSGVMMRRVGYARQRRSRA